MPWITTKKLAEKLNVSQRTARRRAKSGEFQVKWEETGKGRGGKTLLVFFEAKGQNDTPKDKKPHNECENSKDTPKRQNTSKDKIQNKCENSKDTLPAPIKPKKIQRTNPKDISSSDEHPTNYKGQTEFIATSDAASCMNCTQRHVQKMVDQGKFPHSVLIQGEWRIPLHDLPAHAQKKWARISAEKIPQSIVVRPNQEKKALLKAELVQRMEKYAREYTKKTAGEKEFHQLYTDGLIESQLHAELGDISLATIRRWRTELKKPGGYVNLISQRGQKRKHTTVSRIAQEMLLQFLLHPNRVKVGTAINYVQAMLEKKGLDHASRSSMRRWVNDWKKKNYDVWVLKRKGEKALNDEVLPYLIRDDSQLDVGDVFVADGHDLNFQIIHPLTGKPTRCVLVMFLDWASRYPAGWNIVLSENIEAIHGALRHAILRFGATPKMVLLDNGRAFKAKIFTDKKMIETDLSQLGLTGLYQRLGIETHFAMPYHGQSKVIERFFGTLNEQFERLMPTYVGQSIADKPARMHRNEKLHRREYEKNAVIPTVDQVNWAIETWIDEWYGIREHSGIGAKPAEMWYPALGPGIDPHELDFLMMTGETRKVRNGMIQFHGVKYIGDCLYGISQYVNIRYDVNNWDTLYVYDEDWSYMGDVSPVQMVHPMHKLTDDEGVKEQIETQLHEKAKKKKLTKKLAKMQGTEEDHFRSITAALDAHTPDVPEEMPPPAPQWGENIEESPHPQLPEPEDESPETENKRPVFFSDREKYEWLIEQPEPELTDSDRQFIEKFKESSIYNLIYGGNA